MLLIVNNELLAHIIVDVRRQENTYLLLYSHIIPFHYSETQERNEKSWQNTDPSDVRRQENTYLLLYSHIIPFHYYILYWTKGIYLVHQHETQQKPWQELPWQNTDPSAISASARNQHQHTQRRDQSPLSKALELCYDVEVGKRHFERLKVRHRVTEPCKTTSSQNFADWNTPNSILNQYVG